MPSDQPAQRLPCSQCGAGILPMTATRTGGKCMPCAGLGCSGSLKRQSGFGFVEGMCVFGLIAAVYLWTKQRIGYGVMLTIMLPLGFGLIGITGYHLWAGYRRWKYKRRRANEGFEPGP